MGSRSVGAMRGWFRHSLVVAQIALSLVLLASAAVLLRSLWALESVPLGMSPEHVVTAHLTLGRLRYGGAAQQQQFWDELQSRLERIPDVRAFAFSDTLPPSGGMRSTLLASMKIDGRGATVAEGTGGSVGWRAVTPGYFQALGIPVVRGRDFTEQERDSQDEFLILSESLARKLFPDGNALGQRIMIGNVPPWSTVIGVVPDVKNNGLTAGGDPEFYRLRKRLPAYHGGAPNYDGREAYIEVRSAVGTQAMERWLRGEIAALDPTIPVELGTMDERVGKLTARPRFDAELLTGFACVGLLLAMIGLYGVMAFLVTQRTQEIGVRMALGATPRAIARMVLGYAGRWTIGGIALGLVGAFWATRLLRSLLFETSPNDPAMLSGAAALLLAIALAAAWAPSRRAASVDPMVALREE